MSVLEFPVTATWRWADLEKTARRLMANQGIEEEPIAFALRRLRADFERCYLNIDTSAPMACAGRMNEVIDQFKTVLSNHVVALMLAYLELYDRGAR